MEMLKFTLQKFNFHGSLSLYSVILIWNLFLFYLFACVKQCAFIFLFAGEEFETLYKKYESEGRFIRKVKAQALWYAVIESQVGFIFWFSLFIYFLVISQCFSIL